MVGAAGTMTLAVMTRASLGHTGSTLVASAGTQAIYAAVVIAALQASLAPRPLLSGRLAQWLGDISYAVYLSHFFLWILFKLVFVDDPAMVEPAKVAAFVALTHAVSHLLHRWLEVPARRIVQRGGDTLLTRLAAGRRAQSRQG